MGISCKCHINACYSVIPLILQQYVIYNMDCKLNIILSAKLVWFCKLQKVISIINTLLYSLFFFFRHFAL